MSSYKNHQWKRHSIHARLMNRMTLVHIHRSEWFPRFLLLCFRYLEMSSLCSFLSHILCKLLHVFPTFLEVLQLLFLQVVVLCSAHVQAFYAKVHLALLSHGSKLVLVGPSILYGPPSCSPITTASSIVFHFGHIRTWPSTNATLIPFASNAEMERRFFFSPGTNKTSFIFIDFPESSL